MPMKTEFSLGRYVPELQFPTVLQAVLHCCTLASQSADTA